MELQQTPSGRRDSDAGPEALPLDAASAGASLPLAIAGWTLTDPARAAALLEEWLGTADEKGRLTPPCPVACQWAERVIQALPGGEALRVRLLPKLARYLEGAFDRYDTGGSALPLWPSAEEALFPAEYAPGRFTVDLAVLLWNEADAFCRLAEDREEEYARTLDMAEGEQRELDVWLKESFWNPEASAFHRMEDGRTVPDLSPCGFLPLAWGGRTLDMSEGLRARAACWEASAWPARARILFLALLLKTPHNTVVARLLRDGLPSGATPAETAAWAMLSGNAETARAAYLREIPAAARWLDAHGRRMAQAAAGLAGILLLMLLARGVVHRERPPAADLADIERQARLASGEGHHDRAAVLYGRAARLGRPTYFRYRQAGEWMRMGEPAEAERVYRELLADTPGSPNVRLNLALAVWRQGRREEALRLYREFAEDPAMAAVPGLAERARLAADLAERQLSLDRED